MDAINRIKKEIEKSATVFETGGFRPENKITESWIGRVFAYGANEGIPQDSNGIPMVPLAQFYLPILPFVPEQVRDIRILTVFMAEQFPDILAESGDNYVIREYRHEEEFVIKELENPNSPLKRFPLQGILVMDDCPEWDDGGLNPAIEQEIFQLEKSGAIESYYDITIQHYGTKIGGYPSFCQSGIDFGEGFDFIFQVADNPKANLTILDGGSFMFARNAASGIWRVYYDTF